MTTAPTSADTPAATGTPIPIPGGIDTTFVVQTARVRRNTPTLPAALYTGLNAMQVAAWLMSNGRQCGVDFRLDGPPRLLAPGGTELPPGWVLTNLEVVGPQEVGTAFEVVEDTPPPAPEAPPAAPEAPA